MWRIARLLELEPQTVLQLTLDADQCPTVSLRLALQLDRLDALELETAAGATDSLWGQIADWIETYGTPSDQAKAWRRRGCALATRNDLAAAQDAYRRALRILEQARIGATEAADTVFSLWHTEVLLGGGHFPDMGARGIAIQMRNAGPLSWAESMLHAADASRLSNDLYRAHSDYWQALALSDAAGDLRGTHIAASRLADVYAESGRLEASLRMAIRCGDGKKAASASADLSPEDVDSALMQITAPWETAVVDDVLIRLGRRARESTVSRFIDGLLKRSLGAEPAPPDSDTQPIDWRAATALEALASIALQAPDSNRTAVYDRIRAGVRNPRLIAAARACATSLSLANQLRDADTADDLIEVFLAKSGGADYLSPIQAASLASDSANCRKRLIEAAKAGNPQAARALMYITPSEREEAIWESAADPLANKYLHQHVRLVEEIEGEAHTSIHMNASFEEGGNAAVYAKKTTRDQLFDHLIAIATDDGLPESVRASALRAVHPILRVLDPNKVGVVEQIGQGLARGEYVHDPSESRDVDPLSNVQFAVDSAGLLQAAALTALGIIAQLSEPAGIMAELELLVSQALTHEHPAVRAAALETLGRVPCLSPSTEIVSFTSDPSVRVRIGALKALKARTSPQLQACLARAIADPEYAVRATVLGIVQATRDLPLLRQIRDTDEDVYLRRLAGINIEDIAADDSPAEHPPTEGANGSRR